MYNFFFSNSKILYWNFHAFAPNQKIFNKQTNTTPTFGLLTQQNTSMASKRKKCQSQQNAYGHGQKKIWPQVRPRAMYPSVLYIYVYVWPNELWDKNGRQNRTIIGASTTGGWVNNLFINKWLGPSWPDNSNWAPSLAQIPLYG